MSHLPLKESSAAFRQRCLDECLAALSQSDRDTFLSLPDRYTPEAKTPVGIVETNNYPLATEDEEDPGLIGMFALGSHFRHSCRPSVNYYWQAADPQRGLEEIMRFTATRVLKPGDPLTVSYVPLDMDRDQRRRHLAKRAVTCTCEVCSLEGEALAKSDHTRRLINEYSEDLNRMLGGVKAVGGTAPTSLPVAMERLQLVRTELCSHPHYMRGACEDAFDAAYVCGKGELARTMAYATVAALGCTQGSGSRRYTMTKKYCRDLSMHPWSMYHKLNVPPKKFQPKLCSLSNGGFSSILGALNSHLLKPSTYCTNKESERERRARVARETEERRKAVIEANRKRLAEKKERRKQRNKKGKRRNAK
ncbi:hypothetical protein KIPB_010149 [Kipferlia bialata]|uniref:SET domain-containing protein n=1 Tax=Kipferlia bialata TaxID=797122 RepID=A0A9K3D620_9EUKA|nr:hypothetical protein KIPB_010149 [Kipferlia bialata]|eukprot:g10149.t1